MGYYLEVERNDDKAGQLLRNHNAKLASASLADVPDDSHLVCVVRNPLFDAAGIVYDERELAAFNRSDDPRERDWLYVSKDVCRELCGDYSRLEQEAALA